MTSKRPFRYLFLTTGLAALLLVACGGDESFTAGTTGGDGGDGGSGKGGAGGMEIPPPPDPTGWIATGALQVARRNHTATLLQDGRVLVVGGELEDNSMIDAVEIFDPTTATWSVLGPLPASRSNHTATLLQNGSVLVVGGGKSSLIGVPSPDEVMNTCLLFDPKTGNFSVTAPLAIPRSGHRAALLDDGKVLVVGGGANTAFGPCGSVPNCTVANALASAEIYDPATGQWTSTAPMAQARLSFTLTRLTSGELLAVGGASGIESLKTAEIFHPDKGLWMSALPLETQDRLFHSAALLGSGHVLVAGGKKSNTSPLATAEIFDPATSGWTQTAKLSEVRTAAAMLGLPTGRVIMVGGYDQLAQKVLKLAEIFDEGAATWTAIAPMAKARVWHSVTALADGRLLVAGGSVGSSVTKACELSQ